MSMSMTSKLQELFAKFLEDFVKHSERGVEEFFLDVPPVPASRPRVSRYGTYYGKKYTQFKNDAEEACADREGLRLFGPLVCFVEHVVQPPKTTKRDYPNGDVDNYVKGPLDAMTKSEKFWEDDDQVVYCAEMKRYAEPGEEPHVKAYWYEV